MADAAIRVEGLTKRFGNVAALDGIDFEVPAGSVFGLLGPNGAGKTTAVRVLATILRPDGGHAEVMGYDVVRQATAVRFQIGLAGQSAAVDANLTGRENLRLIGRLAQMRRRDVAPRADELLARFDLSRRRRPAGAHLLGRHAAATRRRRRPRGSARPSCSSTSPPRASTSRAAPSCGPSSASWSPRARRCCSRPSTWRRPTAWPTASPWSTTAASWPTTPRRRSRPSSPARSSRSAWRPRSGRVAPTSCSCAPWPTIPSATASTVRLTSNEGPSALIETLRLLDANSLTPATLTVREPSLDDAFLALTGRRAESGDGEDRRRPVRRRPAAKRRRSRRLTRERQ